MLTIAKDERLETLNDLITVRKGTALDVGTARHFFTIYPQRAFSRVLGINAFRPTLDEQRRKGASRPEWEFRCIDVTHYRPREQFDLVTMLHVAEHLTRGDLQRVLDRLTKVCRGLFVIETPEQFDDNERSAEVKGNPYELHRELVTAGFLKRWAFFPAFRYQQNDRFSNAVYLRRNEP